MPFPLRAAVSEPPGENRSFPQTRPRSSPGPSGTGEDSGSRRSRTLREKLLILPALRRRTADSRDEAPPVACIAEELRHRRMDTNQDRTKSRQRLRVLRRCMEPSGKQARRFLAGTLRSRMVRLDLDPKNARTELPARPAYDDARCRRKRRRRFSPRAAPGRPSSAGRALGEVRHSVLLCTSTPTFPKRTAAQRPPLLLARSVALQFC